MSNSCTHNAAGPDNRPPGAGDAGGPTQVEHLSAPDTAPETGTPAFSKGGHLADTPSDKSRRGESDLTNGDEVRGSSAEPPRQ